MADHPAIDIELLQQRVDAFLVDRLYAALDDFQPLAIHNPDEDERWRVFFRDAVERDAAAHVLQGAFRGEIRVTTADVPDQDWARRSQRNLKAVRVGKLTIAPPWDVPRGTRGSPAAEFPVIVIEPSMGFGTGHHATTRLCLELLQMLDLRGARVVDVGTGSGVLALGAWKLGAADVVAIDHDRDALENARSNIGRNGAGAAIDIICDDIAGLRAERADVTLANLTGAVLVRYSAELLALVKAGGYLIVSGFAPADVPILRRAFRELAVIAEREDGDWAAVTLQRSPSPR